MAYQIGRITAITARQFHTSSRLPGKLVQPKLAVFGIEGRYATALYSAAKKQNSLDTVTREVIAVQEALGKNKTFTEYLASPIISKDMKQAAIKEVLQKGKFSSLTVNFFDTLADNGRMKNLINILNAFQRIMSAEKGEILAEVVTAKPLDAAEQKELHTALQGFLGTGSTLKLEAKTDPAIIGGMQVSIGDRYVDMSISSKVKKYKQMLEETVL